MLPKHWGTLVALGLLWIIGRLPLSASRRLGAGLGALMYRVNGKRRRIAHVNVDLCFPDMSPQARAELVRRHFRASGQAYLDLGFLAWASERRFLGAVHLVGLPHLDEALSRGRRVILLAPHFVGMNVGGIAVAGHVPTFSMYNPQRNPIVDWLLHKTRSRYASPLIARKRGLRPVLRGLGEGMSFYFLPDEDLGPKHSVFAPFFGVPAATLPTLGRLAAAADAVVIPCYTRLVPGGYEVRLEPALADFPVGDAVPDAARMNAEIERAVRGMPEQYLWTFKLFKTRPPGVPSPYA
ncbi:lysophospholipid acyltransferase family protein [Sulfurifustis variabilis]|nr:lysophospholipid acyltransferase family protein [Sulfurifustis variabilis]